jgi:glycosyltransferase involved in cell wall biosynthesis
VAVSDPVSPAGVTAAWLHRGLSSELWLRLHTTDDRLRPSHLVALAPDGTSMTLGPRLAFAEQVEENVTICDARFDVAEVLAKIDEPAGTWQIRAQTPSGATPIATAGAHPPLVFPLLHHHRPLAITVHVDESELRLVVADLDPWLEVEQVETVDGELHITGRVAGEGPGGDIELSLEHDGTPPLRAGPVTVSGTHFEARCRTSSLAPGTWRLWAQSPGAGRSRWPLARRLDDVERKDRAIAYPWYQVTAATTSLEAQPTYTRDNTLTLKVREAPVAADEVTVDRGDRTRPRGGRPGGPSPEAAPPRDPLTLAVRAVLALVALAARMTRLRRGRRPQDPQPVHILLLNAYGMGGTIRTVWNLANALARSLPVRLVSVLGGNDGPFFEADPRVDLESLVPAPWVRDADRGGRLRSALAERPSVLVPGTEPRFGRFSLLTDVEIVRTLWRLPRGILVTSRPGLNLIAARFAPGRLTTVAQEHLTLAAHRPGLRQLILRDYPRLDALAVLTEEDERDYREQLANSSRTLVRSIPNGVPDTPFPQSDLQARYVVAAGRFGPAKGFDLLVPAFARVAEQRPDWGLRIYGGGEQEKRIRRLIRRHDLAEHIQLMGTTDRIWQEMAKASIFVLSSRFEGFGMVLIEAFRCGLPAVSFACPRGPREIVRHEENGLLVPEQDVDALGDALIRMIDDEELRTRCASGALASGKTYSMQHVEQRWRQLFAQASGG